MPFRTEQLPSVSIVIPLHNHAAVVGTAIESCLTQVYPNVEVIVVDDGSSDSSGEAARRYEPYVRVVHVPHSVGLCVARNIGLWHATGDFVLFHDSDDLLFPDRLWHDLNVLTREPRADVIFSINRWYRDGELLRLDPEPICRRERRLLHQLMSVSDQTEQSLISMLEHGGPQHSCVLYRTAVVRAIGGYANELEHHAEKKLLFRALCRGATVAVNPRVTSARRLHDCPERSEWEHRADDDRERLTLVEGYAAALKEAGLLNHQSLHKAFTAHIIGRVYENASRGGNATVAVAAQKLIELLGAGPVQDCAAGVHRHTRVVANHSGL